jgi:hypothetical protein
VLGGIYFTKKWRAETPQPGLEFENFKTRLKSSVFKCISWLNGLLIIECDDRGFLKNGVKTYQMAPKSPLKSPVFFCLHIHSPYESTLHLIFFGFTCDVLIFSTKKNQHGTRKMLWRGRESLDKESRNRTRLCNEDRASNMLALN